MCAMSRAAGLFCSNFRQNRLRYGCSRAFCSSSRVCSVSKNDQQKGSSSKQTPPPDNEASSKLKKWGCVAVGGALTVAAAPLVLSAAGFTSGGIAAGSIASAMMASSSSSAILGAVVPVLQSAGAAGLGVLGSAFCAGTGGVVGGTGNAFYNYIKKKKGSNNTSDKADMKKDDPKSKV